MIASYIEWHIMTVVVVILDCWYFWRSRSETNDHKTNDSINYDIIPVIQAILLIAISHHDDGVLLKDRNTKTNITTTNTTATTEGENHSYHRFMLM